MVWYGMQWLLMVQECPGKMVDWNDFILLPSTHWSLCAGESLKLSKEVPSRRFLGDAMVTQQWVKQGEANEITESFARCAWNHFSYTWGPGSLPIIPSPKSMDWYYIPKKVPSLVILGCEQQGHRAPTARWLSDKYCFLSHVGSDQHASPAVDLLRAIPQNCQTNLQETTWNHLNPLVWGYLGSRTHFSTIATVGHAVSAADCGIKGLDEFEKGAEMFAFLQHFMRSGSALVKPLSLGGAGVGGGCWRWPFWRFMNLSRLSWWKEHVWL